MEGNSDQSVTFNNKVLASYIYWKDIPIEDMFNLATKNNQTWGIQGYEAQKKYLDPVM